MALAKGGSHHGGGSHGVGIHGSGSHGTNGGGATSDCNRRYGGSYLIIMSELVLYMLVLKS